ncbi:MAG: nuclease/transposase family protein, partial [Candidatus Dormibacteria bacterium]
MSFGSSLRKSFVRDQVLSQEAQTLARRAFRAVERWHYGKGGKPRFKAARRGIRSLECKDGCGLLRVKANQGGELGGLQWGKGLAVPFAQPKSLGEQAELDRITALVTAGKLISCRITRTKVRGRWAYRAQLVMEGAPPVRHPVGTEQVSIDLGPSTAHVVSETNAFHASLAPGIVPANQDLRRAQRKLDRQHRQGSPSCFDAQHRHQAEGCDWEVRSHNAQRTQVKVAEFHRVLAARRDTEHGQLATQLIRLGPN